MFNFVVKYFGFLKILPGAALVFDIWLKVYTLFSYPFVLDHMDYIENEILKWDGVTKSLHKYGGIQFNYKTHEIGHIHGNGLLDIRLSRRLKQDLMIEGKVTDHHVFKNTGWVSFYIRSDADKTYAMGLLKISYMIQRGRSHSPSRNNQTTLTSIVTMLA